MGGRWLLYGANGYTGRLVTAVALRMGERPVLAGRSGEAIRPLADAAGLEARVVALGDAAGLRAALADVDAVVHAAGPFSVTSRPMVDACLATRTHYLDITGEIAVFEAVLGRADEARAAGVALLPGVGLDVVPTDCLAARLSAALPGAAELDLALHARGGTSPGTAKTSIEGLATGNRARVEGRIVQIAWGQPVRQVPFADRTRTAVAIPWGDVSSAWHTTGIPTIHTFLAMSPGAAQRARNLAFLEPLMRLRPVLWAAQRLLERTRRGPDEAARQAGRSEFWGEARHEDGRAVQATLSAPNGYALTAESCVRAARRVLDGTVEPGAWTPSRAFGADYVETLEGVTFHGVREALSASPAPA
jgi:saccharopine dehydrogenase (NAD+, L-lysine-forming)